MIKKLIRFVLWLGLFDIVDKERETMQRLDQLMLEMSSMDLWKEYMELRGYSSTKNHVRQPWQDGPTMPVIQNGGVIVHNDQVY